MSPRQCLKPLFQSLLDSLSIAHPYGRPSSPATRKAERNPACWLNLIGNTDWFSSARSGFNRLWRSPAQADRYVSCQPGTALRQDRNESATSYITRPHSLKHVAFFVHFSFLNCSHGRGTCLCERELSRCKGTKPPVSVSVIVEEQLLLARTREIPDPMLPVSEIAEALRVRDRQPVRSRTLLQDGETPGGARWCRPSCWLCGLCSSTFTFLAGPAPLMRLANRWNSFRSGSERK